MTLSEQDIDTCLRLVDDPDELVTGMVLDRLYEAGPTIVPRLRNFMSDTQSSVARDHCATLVHRFRTDPLMELCAMVVTARVLSKDVDLEEAMLTLNRFGRPEDDASVITTTLDALALRCHAEFIAMHPANDLTQVMCLHNVLFEEDGFHGAEDTYHDPNSSYLTSVIDRREGIPIALSAIYLLLAERIGLDMHGIGMPLHFIVYSPGLDVFIDPFHGGVFLTREECSGFVDRAGIPFNDAMLAPVRNIDLLERMIRNLIHAHQRIGDLWEAHALHGVLTEIVQGRSE